MIQNYQIDLQHQFIIEKYKERLRLIIAQDFEEIVCRKETKKNLLNFLQNNEGHLFKGRLQLEKKEDDISIIVKGKLLGKIKKIDFEKLIDNAIELKSISF